MNPPEAPRLTSFNFHHIIMTCFGSFLSQPPTAIILTRDELKEAGDSPGQLDYKYGNCGGVRREVVLQRSAGPELRG